MKFWSLGRSGLFPVDGRPSWRVFRAAVASCGLPRFSVSFDREGFPARRLLLSARLSFSAGGLFRCWFVASLVVPPRLVPPLRLVAGLWLLPVRVTGYREDAFFPAPSRWAAFREALASPAMDVGF